MGVICKVLKDTTSKSLNAPILRAVSKHAKAVYSDEWSGYKTIHKVFNHYVVDHGRKIYAVGDIHTNDYPQLADLKFGRIPENAYLCTKFENPQQDEAI